MTRILALETAGEACSVALLDDSLPQGQQVRETFELAPRKQTERALPMVEALLGEAGLLLKEVWTVSPSGMVPGRLPVSGSLQRWPRGWRFLPVCPWWVSPPWRPARSVFPESIILHG